MQSATVIIDFNDAALGALNGQSSGTGVSGNWAGSTAVLVVAGDLTPQASTNYAITQGGTSFSVQGPDPSNGRQASIELTTDFTGNTIWGSFLVTTNGDSSANAGIAFNNGPTSSSQNDPRVLSNGTGFLVRLS